MKPSLDRRMRQLPDRTIIDRFWDALLYAPSMIGIYFTKLFALLNLSTQNFTNCSFVVTVFLAASVKFPF